MFDSSVLEVAVGLVFCYCGVSLIVSSVNEGIASALGLRAATLLEGIKGLLNDKDFVGLARDLYNHALINPQDIGRAQKESDLSYTPSYIAPRHFALALIDALEKVPGESARLPEAIAAIQDPQLHQLLQGMYARTGGDIDKLRDELAAWFNQAMDRVSGQYKRRCQLICFLLALLVAVSFNIDSFHLFRTLWDHSALAAAIAAAPGPHDVDSAIKSLQMLPIGWQSFPPDVESWSFWLALAGWLVTASSALFGAPFWFDLLQGIARLRGTGDKPDDDR